MSLITWEKVEGSKHKERGSTQEELQHDRQATYEIYHNCNLIINSANTTKHYLASNADAKLMAELIEKGRTA